MQSRSARMSDKRNALLIATGEYADPKLPSLVGPTVDVRELGRVLGDASIGGFEVAVVENAAFRSCVSDSTNSSRTERSATCSSCTLVPRDQGRLGPPVLHRRGHPTQQARLDGHRRSMGAAAHRRLAIAAIVLLLDCCFGGAFANAMARRAPGSEEVGIKERFDGKGRLVLTASTATQYAFEAGELHGEPQPSVFTRAIVRGLETGDADRDGDGNVSIDELYDFAVDAPRAGRLPDADQGGLCRRRLVPRRQPSRTAGLAGRADGRTQERRRPVSICAAVGSPVGTAGTPSSRSRARQLGVDLVRSLAIRPCGARWRSSQRRPTRAGIRLHLDIPALSEAKAHA